MNKLFSNILGLIILTILLGCEKELNKYEGKPTIYFNEAGRLPGFTGEILRDSTILSFSLAKVQDSIVNMVIKTTGAKQDTDRPYKLVINTNSDAIAGNHYEILNKSFFIKKNQLSDTVKIKFFRKVDLQAKTFLLSFDLLENENFSIEMKYRLLNGTKKKLSLINYRWYINDIIKKPGRWQDDSFGVFTRKKLLLMAEILGVEPAYLDTSVSLPEIYAFGKFMQRYLNEKKVAGNTVYEENGSEMVMGPGAQ